MNGKLPVDLYVEAVAALTRPQSEGALSGIFFITSCNFTQEELERKFLPAGTLLLLTPGFAVEHVVPAPTFMFVRRATHAGWPARLHRYDRGIPKNTIDHVTNAKLVVLLLRPQCPSMRTCACGCRMRRARS